MKKKILITGSKGLIGSSLVNYYKNKFNIIKLDIYDNEDLTNEKFVENFFKKNKNIFAVINAHGLNSVPVNYRKKKIEPIDIKITEINDFINHNLISNYLICINYIKNNKKGRLININTMYSKFAPRHQIYKKLKHPGYSISKGALGSMTKYFGTYYAPNFLINEVTLGGVHQKNLDKKFLNNFNKNVPMSRMMNLNEFYPAFDFLLDENNTYTVASEIVIDGGYLSW
tara:strand:- start:73 stop:756 length:684 start_codon:yes stop_codon:yes gene_type:complete